MTCCAATTFEVCAYLVLVYVYDALQMANDLPGAKQALNLALKNKVPVKAIVHPTEREVTVRRVVASVRVYYPMLFPE